jgi:hypothetical protein
LRRCREIRKILIGAAESSPRAHVGFGRSLAMAQVCDDVWVWIPIADNDEMKETAN